ncbi:hypothetical protein AAGW05_16510 [Arthrobacter sp. LAPM80]|uniref:hypothetical protein n=1 Tax=Arthrobacter sp. LAPM80 TaxID=3141788 RepID=UPI00398AC8CD
MHPALARIALFDCIAHTTDRKSGHVIFGTGGLVWGIAHGTRFSSISTLSIAFGPGSMLETVIRTQ